MVIVFGRRCWPTAEQGRVVGRARWAWFVSWT